MRYTRYAIYVTLPPGPLAAFGAAWLGWDAAGRRSLDPPEVPDLPAPVDALTAAPRRYGLHGTIKPPFRLAEGRTEQQLETALSTFCAQHPPVTLDGLVLSRLGSFLALTPVGDTFALSELAASVVHQFDGFRAPVEAAELARRKGARLTARQGELLELYGYPYVMEAFRFHITLTGRMSAGHLARTDAALRPLLDPLLPDPFHLDALTLCAEAGDGRFHEIRRIPLSGQPRKQHA